MLKRITIILLLLTVHSVVVAETVKEFRVSPLTRYKLLFNATGQAGTWELQVLNKEGLLPYEGVFKQKWQAIVPERENYSHSFLTPRDGVLLKFIIHGEHGLPQVSNIKLEEITSVNPIINGDFSAGLYNYSGWNDHFLAELVKTEKGKIVLKCEPTGYALTDPIPVEAGGVYKYTKGSYTGRVLVYDYDLLRVDVIDDYHHKKNPFLKMPADAAYIRLEFCDGRTYRKGAVPVIDKVGIELVSKGEDNTGKIYPAYPGEIVLPVNSPLPAIRAAREIQHWIRKISGKEMRVLAVPSNRNNTKILIGKKLAEKDFPGDIKYLANSDGFAIRKKGNHIHIFGAKPAGTLFGAIRFLENNTDIIFARPRKEFGTIYSKNPNLVFSKTNMISRPAFAHRIVGAPYAARSDDGIWQSRSGFNTSPFFYNQYRRKEEGGIFSFEGNYMAAIAQCPKYTFEKCSKEHPEFFAIINGKRLIKPNGYICYSAPGVAKAMAEGLCDVVKKSEDRGQKIEYINVRTRDGWTVCSCKKCMKPIPLPDGKLLKPKGETAHQDPLFFSTRMTLMLNKVAEEFAKRYPNIHITVPAYIYSAVPPAIKHDPLLVPSFCAYDTSSLRFPILDGKNNHFNAGHLWENRFREFLRRNKTDNRKLSMFAYYYPPGFSAVADSAAADWLEMVKSGNVHAIHLDSFTPDTDNYKRRVQYLHMWDYQAIEKWIIARLIWDPTMDPQKLREYYIKRTYGKAAQEMLEFYNTIRKAWKNPAIKAPVNCHSPRATLFETFIVKPGNEKKLRSLLVSAEKKAENPKVKILIQRALTAYDRFADTLKRIYVPYVPESTDEWDMANSNFWLPALKFGEFKHVSTWADLKNAPAENQTQVSIMRDKENLYVRFHALKAESKDRIELILTAKRGATKYLFALERDGKRYDLKNSYPWNCPNWKGNVENEKDSYIAMFKIPLTVIKELNTETKDIKFFAKFSRVISTGKERKESSLTGVSITMTHYMNYWTALTIKKGRD